MPRRTLSALAALAAALPLAGQAETMDYSFVELGYVDASYDDADLDGDGFALRGSVGFGQNYFAFAEYEDLGLDFNVDVTTFIVGVGGHWPLQQNIDLVGRIGIVDAELEGPRGFDSNEDGFTLGAHVRAAVMPKVEVEGGLDYIDVDSGDDTILVLKGRYFFVENFAGGVRLEFGDREVIGVEGRLTF